MTASHALLTDLYELTMAAAYLEEGMQDRTATFSLFVRDFPSNRGYLVAGGLADVLEYLETLRFTDDDVAVLDGLGMFEDTFLEHLRTLRFDGSVRAVPEGRLIFPEEPLLEVEAPIGIAQVVETFLLNQVTTQTTLNTKAARHLYAADGRAVVDFALRRAQGIEAGSKLVRAVGTAGLAGTSNVAEGTRQGVPLSGTMAHAFVQAHTDETEAFRAFARLFGERTVLLVDTYDTIQGVERAIEVAREMRDRGVELRGVRLDSGDLAELARRSRQLLDDAGFPDVLIFASGGLDEIRISELLGDRGAPIDGFGVGSALGVSKDEPVLDSVYKLVEFDGRPVRKLSTGKAIWPGPKQVWRRPDDDVLGTADQPAPPGTAEELLRRVMADGRRTEDAPTGDPTADVGAAHAAFERDWEALGPGVKDLTAPERREVTVSEELRALTERVDAARAGP